MANAIIFDTETNGLTPNCSVLSITAIKIDTHGEELEVFDRFYYPKEPYNMGAINVNGLNKETIDYHRKISSATYARHFMDDAELREFFKDTSVEIWVAHNYNFDIKFLNKYGITNPSKGYCTMLESKDIVKVEWNDYYQNWKWPKLREACEFFKIDFNEEDAHSSLYDVRKTIELYQKLMALKS
jgi:DNA polymerase-3 subunit epsilon